MLPIQAVLDHAHANRLHRRENLHFSRKRQGDPVLRRGAERVEFDFPDPEKLRGFRLRQGSAALELENYNKVLVNAEEINVFKFLK